MIADFTNPPNNTPYIFVIGGMIVVVIAGIVAINSYGSHLNDMEIIGILVGLATSTTMSILAFMKSNETHNIVNSRVDEFKENLRALSASMVATSRAEGVVEGRDDVLSRQVTQPAVMVGTIPTTSGNVINAEETIVNSDKTTIVSKK